MTLFDLGVEHANMWLGQCDSPFEFKLPLMWLGLEDLNWLRKNGHDWNELDEFEKDEFLRGYEEKMMEAREEWKKKL